MPIASWDLSVDKGLEVPQLVSIRKQMSETRYKRTCRP
jgi:hypothetical protein